MKIKQRKGKVFYAKEFDFLTFKTYRVDYRRSVEYKDYVVDLGEHEVLSGMRIFDASKVLGLQKKDLVHIQDWSFEVDMKERKVKILLDLKMKNGTVKTYHKKVIGTVHRPYVLHECAVAV